MPRRKSFGLGPKRRSYGKAVRLNTKGGIPTSVSVGGAGMRVNVGKRGTWTSARNPVTGRSTTISNRKGTRNQNVSNQPQQTVVYVNPPAPKQLPFLVRALWFLFVGWYLALLWITVAIILACTILGLPIATWMFERTNAVMTLQVRR